MKRGHKKETKIDTRIAMGRNGQEYAPLMQTLEELLLLKSRKHVRPDLLMIQMT